MWAIDRWMRGPRIVVRQALSVVGLLGCTASLAQSVAPTVTEADVARAARQQPVITDQDLEAAQRRHRMPTDDALARVPIPAAPNVDALPVPHSRSPIDLGAIARGFDEAMQAKSGAGPLALDRSLLVFVSFSMPMATLERLVDQASTVGATLILRGLVDDSLQRTVMRAQSLIGKRQVGMQIDPQAFDRFGVEVTPTFVLLKGGAQNASCATGACVPPSQFALAAGDVSVEYALEYFKKNAPAFAHDAQTYLAKVKGRKP